MTKDKDKKAKPTQSGGASLTRTRRKERQKERKERRQIYMVIGVVVIALVAVGIFIMINQPASAPIPEGVLDRYSGIQQGANAGGYPMLGNPDALVRVEEYSNYSCPSCASFHQATNERLTELARQGLISFSFIPIPSTGGIRNAIGAAKAALCAAEQNAFFEYHDALFHWHENFGNKAFSQNRLETGIGNLGLNVSQYNNCVGSSRIKNLVDSAESTFKEQKMSGTPAIFVNGIQIESGVTIDDWAAVLFATIDEQLVATGAVPTTPDAETTPEVPGAEATQEAPTPEATEPPAEETPEATSEA